MADLKADSVCPHCYEELPAAPTGRSECPFCGGEMVRRRNQRIFKTKLLSGSEAAAADWVDMLGCYDVDDDVYQEMRSVMEKRTGAQADPLDVVWTIMECIAAGAVQDENLNVLRQIYYTQSVFLYQTGRTGSLKMRKKAAIAELAMLRRAGVSRVRIAGNNPCPVCAKSAGRTMTVDEALRQMPVPCTGCMRRMWKGRRGFCRCAYVPARTAD